MLESQNENKYCTKLTKYCVTRLRSLYFESKKWENLGKKNGKWTHKPTLQWTQNISEFEPRHDKRGSADRKCKGEEEDKESVTENIFSSFQFWYSRWRFNVVTFTLYRILWTRGTRKL
jgi:hypothetical protein